MLNILARAACYIAIILMGYILRRKGFFGEETFGVLSKIVIKITLPAKEAAPILADATKSQVVQVIGRKIVLFRRNPQNPKIELKKK